MHVDGFFLAPHPKKVSINILSWTCYQCVINQVLARDLFSWLHIAARLVPIITSYYFFVLHSLVYLVVLAVRGAASSVHLAKQVLLAGPRHRISYHSRFNTPFTPSAQPHKRLHLGCACLVRALKASRSSTLVA